mmetsp:Transcript_57087/g.114467  ORF Transcript_57087/g.114467 Transcript_57087/m.114467 type:complete len:134 (-) Transcript_57087:304-705(-)
MSSALIKKLTSRDKDMGAWSCKGVTESLDVDIGWCTETVLVHPEGGPQVYKEDGTYGFMTSRGFGWSRANGGVGIGTKTWSGMSSTEKSVAIEVAAKMNAALRDRYGEEYFKGARLPSRQQVDAAKKRMGLRS